MTIETFHNEFARDGALGYFSVNSELGQAVLLIRTPEHSDHVGLDSDVSRNGRFHDNLARHVLHWLYTDMTLKQVKIRFVPYEEQRVALFEILKYLIASTLDRRS